MSLTIGRLAERAGVGVHLLSLRLDASGRCEDVRRRAEVKLQEVETRIRSLQRIQQTLRRLAEACTGEGGVDECPILEALEPEEADA